MAASCSTRPACSPTPTPAPSSPDELAALRHRRPQPGDDDRVAARRPRLPPRRARQGCPRAASPPSRPPASSASRSPPGSSSASARTGADRVDALEAIAASHRRHGHVQEVIVQNFLPKAGTAMHRRPPCPPDDFLEAIALARLILPPEIHLQAPPNLSDDFGVLLDAGIDDWGGVSPVTADHVNPERPWPALDRLRAVTEAHGFALAPRLTIYPEFALDPDRWLDPGLAFPVLDRSDAEGLGRDDPGAVFPEQIAARRRRRHRRRGRADRRARNTRGTPAPRRAAACSCPPSGRGRAGTAASARCSRACCSARRSARTRSSRCSPPAGPRWRPSPRWPTSCAGRGRRRRHLRPQPQHQLHERLHVQVPVLRLLEGAAVAQPARHARTCSPSRTSPSGCARRGERRHRGVPAGRHPPRLRRRLLHRRRPGRAATPRPRSTSTASPPSRSPRAPSASASRWPTTSAA